MEKVQHEVRPAGEVSERSEPEVVVSVVIACYNAVGLLDTCLESIYAHPPERPFEVVVVDDASRDGCSEMVGEKFPQVHLLTNPRNLGYARSTNAGIAAAKGDFIHLLNADVEVLPGALDNLVSFLESHPEAGAAASLLYNGDGSVQPSVKALPSVRSALFGARSWLSRWWPENPGTRKELLHWKAEEGAPFTAGYVSSASLMVHRDVFRSIGDLDTSLFYFLDADFCKRIWDSKRKVFCVPDAGVVHHEHQGGSLGSLGRRFRAVGNFHYGAHRYFRKHGGKSPWHPIHLVVILCLGARFAFSGIGQVFREVAGVDRRHLEAQNAEREARSAPAE